MENNENKKLYPFRFVPVTREKDWGVETTLLADLGETDSEVADGWLAGNSLSDLMQVFLERLVGESSFDFYGTQFHPEKSGSVGERILQNFLAL